MLGRVDFSACFAPDSIQLASPLPYSYFRSAVQHLHWIEHSTQMQNRFRTLFDTLCQARVATSPSAADVIQHRLQQYKPDFLRLLDDLPKNAQDRTELQSGTWHILQRIKGIALTLRVYPFFPPFCRQGNDQRYSAQGQ